MRIVIRIPLIDAAFHRLIIALERLEVFLEIQRGGAHALKLVTTAMNGPRDLHDDLQHPPSIESVLGEVRLHCAALFFQMKLDDEKLFTQVMEYFMTDLLEWYGGRGMAIPYDEVDRYVLPILVSMSRQVDSMGEIMRFCDEYVVKLRLIEDVSDEERKRFEALPDFIHHPPPPPQDFPMPEMEPRLSVHRRGSATDGYNRLMDAMLNLYDTIIPAKHVRDILTAYVKSLPEYTDETLEMTLASKNQKQSAEVKDASFVADAEEP